MTAPTAGDPARATTPARTRRTEATMPAPPPGVPDHDSPKISGARITGTVTWMANITGATRVAGLLPRALISLSRARPSEAAAVASQIAATRIEPADSWSGGGFEGAAGP